MAVPSVSGKYRGKFFRSLLELRFMKFMESVGIDVVRDVEYEVHSVSYVDGQGLLRKYLPDFHVKPFNAVYEVKHTGRWDDPDNAAKWAAAQEYFEERGKRFVVFTEKMIPKRIRVTARRARKDPNVVLNERSVRHAARVRRRAKRNRRKRSR